MASTAEVRVVNVAGLVQGITLVTFPAASTIFTDPAEYDLSSTQYGAMFLPKSSPPSSQHCWGHALPAGSAASTSCCLVSARIRHRPVGAIRLHRRGGPAHDNAVVRHRGWCGAHSAGEGPCRRAASSADVTGRHERVVTTSVRWQPDHHPRRPACGDRAGRSDAEDVHRGGTMKSSTASARRTFGRRRGQVLAPWPTG